MESCTSHSRTKENTDTVNELTNPSPPNWNELFDEQDVSGGCCPLDECEVDDTSVSCLLPYQPLPVVKNLSQPDIVCISARIVCPLITCLTWRWRKWFLATLKDTSPEFCWLIADFAMNMKEDTLEAGIWCSMTYQRRRCQYPQWRIHRNAFQRRTRKLSFSKSHWCGCGFLLWVLVETRTEFVCIRSGLQSWHWRYRKFRALDRNLNEASYPRLSFPHLYLMQGGYKTFYQNFPVNCALIFTKRYRISANHEPTSLWVLPTQVRARRSVTCATWNCARVCLIFSKARVVTSFTTNLHKSGLSCWIRNSEIAILFYIDYW